MTRDEITKFVAELVAGYDMEPEDAAALHEMGKLAALRAPAVTGEAGRVSYIESACGCVSDTQQCRANPPHSAAPPAAGAPPALGALDIPTLLQEAKRFGRLAEQFVGPMPPTWTKRRAERDEAVHALRDAEKLLIGLVEKQRAWSPAPAPVAPPAGDRDATCAWDCTRPYPHDGSCSPAPPAVAGDKLERQIRP